MSKELIDITGFSNPKTMTKKEIEEQDKLRSSNIVEESEPAENEAKEKGTKPDKKANDKAP